MSTTINFKAGAPVRDKNGRFKSAKTTAKPKTSAKRKLTTSIGFVLDGSYSMHKHSSNLKKFLATLIKELGDATQTYVVFDDKPQLVASHDKYRVLGGSTALFDAIGYTVDQMKSKKADRYLLYVLTDGEENVSTIFKEKDIVSMIASLESTDKWSFVFELPKGYRDNFHRRYGIPLENMHEWDTINEEMVQVSTQSFNTYMRSTGTSTQSFYQPVVTSVSPTQVKRELTDLRRNYEVLAVPPLWDGEQIRDFMEDMGYDYKKGQAFYQLNRTEKVQPNKKVLIVEIGKKSIYGGIDARELIGLPTDGVTYSKVTPGAHPKYNIFVQSTSVNRKLQANTFVLYER